MRLLSLSLLSLLLFPPRRAPSRRSLVTRAVSASDREDRVLPEAEEKKAERKRRDEKHRVEGISRGRNLAQNYARGMRSNSIDGKSEFCIKEETV